MGRRISRDAVLIVVLWLVSAGHQCARGQVAIEIGAEEIVIRSRGMQT